MKLFLLGLALGLVVAALLSLPPKRGGLVLSNQWADSEAWRGQP